MAINDRDAAVFSMFGAAFSLANIGGVEEAALWPFGRGQQLSSSEISTIEKTFLSSLIRMLEHGKVDKAVMLMVGPVALIDFVNNRAGYEDFLKKEGKIAVVSSSISMRGKALNGFDVDAAKSVFSTLKHKYDHLRSYSVGDVIAGSRNYKVIILEKDGKQYVFASHFDKEKGSFSFGNIKSMEKDSAFKTAKEILGSNGDLSLGLIFPELRERSLVKGVA